ncbi:hypothetical protein SDC9_193597 [bioreactor metagenome]|uniref:Uncharacterized protein n=1 Tax=bioreactor metagenome TaxID=1076179 RepID=A0A645I439_9ZZZZ
MNDISNLAVARDDGGNLHVVTGIAVCVLMKARADAANNQGGAAVLCARALEHKLVGLDLKFCRFLRGSGACTKQRA